ncbi:Alpha/Beta hydrolase protein [Xylariaceae sp. FL0804]|nr:Alpha/Beta hydrolase protein [Xylariaceae sp. FL0804]
MKSYIFDAATGSRLRYLEFFEDDSGSGSGSGRRPPPPLVMIHGLGLASSFEFPHVALAPPLRGRHVVLVDLPGHGYSDRPDPATFGYRVADYAAVVAALVRDRLLPPLLPQSTSKSKSTAEAEVGAGGGSVSIDLFGHSMGGAVAIEIADLLGLEAEARGVRVASLVVAEGNLDAGGGDVSRRVAATEGGEAAYAAEPGGGHARMTAEAGETGPVQPAVRAAYPVAVYRAARSLVEGRRSSPKSWRERFLGQHPTTRKAFIFGEQSLPDPDVDALRAEGVKVLVVKDAGHLMGMDNPVGLAEAIAEATTPPVSEDRV